MSRLNQYLGLSDAEPRVIGLARKFAGFVILIEATITISTTYFLIFVAEALGNGDFLAGIAVVGVLVVVQMTVQTLFDYPTGVIGDWIGQRYILATAFLTYSIVFYLVSMATSAQSTVRFVASCRRYDHYVLSWGCIPTGWRGTKSKDVHSNNSE